MEQIANFAIADYGLNYAISLKYDIIHLIKEPIDETTQTRITAIALLVIGGSFVVASGITALTSVPLVIFNPFGVVKAIVSIFVGIIVGRDMAIVGKNLSDSLIYVPEPPPPGPEEKTNFNLIAFFWPPEPEISLPSAPQPPPRIPYYYNDTWFAKDLYDAVLTRCERYQGQEVNVH